MNTKKLYAWSYQVSSKMFMLINSEEIHVNKRNSDDVNVVWTQKIICMIVPSIIKNININKAPRILLYFVINMVAITVKNKSNAARPKKR